VDQTLDQPAGSADDYLSLMIGSAQMEGKASVGHGLTGIGLGKP